MYTIQHAPHILNRTTGYDILTRSPLLSNLILFSKWLANRPSYEENNGRTAIYLTERQNLWTQLGVQLPNPSDYDVAFSKLTIIIKGAELLTAYLLGWIDHDCSLGHSDLVYEINDKIWKARLWSNAHAPLPPLPKHTVRYSLTKQYGTSICLINFIGNVQH
jgi:hypothetical protein